MNKELIAYHFTGPKLRDGSPIPQIGHKLVFPGKPTMCERGLHFSLHPFDALKYAPGPFLHRVRIGGIVEHGEDKGVCTERTILASVDATSMLRKFACEEALSVLPSNAPDIVRRYLQTQDESLRDAAWAAVWGAGWDAVWDAARAAARDAVWGAVWDAAWAAVWDAAQGAAWAAARDAEWDAAQAAARDAARNKQRAKFLAMVNELFTKE